MTPQIRCSELDRVLSCNGSLTLTRLVDARSGDEAGEGLALHHTSAVRMDRDLGATAPDGLGPHDPAWPSLKASGWISDFYVRHVQENLPHDWSLECELPLAFEFILPAPTDVTVVEWIDGRPVITRQPVDRFILSGHIDCCAISPDGTEAMGWDLKTGYDPVDSADQNEQMLGYIVLLKRAYPNLRRATFFIVQPRNDEDEGFERVSSVTVNFETHDAIASLTARIGQALANSMELNSGKRQCAWCSAALQCEALKRLKESMKVTLTPQMLAQVKKTPDDATLADWVLSAKTLARPIEDAETLAKERIAEKGEIVAQDGTRISVKTGRGGYTVKDHLGLWEAVKELLPEPMRARCAKFSMSGLKDAFAEHMNIPKSGRSTVTSESVFDSKIRPHVEQNERRTFQFL